jgi:restriction endonuclease Mrr
MLWPGLMAVEGHGGSISIDEMAQSVIELAGFSEAQQGVLHGDGPETEIGYRLAWARTHLKDMGLLTNSRRGVWTLTDGGHQFLALVKKDKASAHKHLREMYTKYVVEMRAAKSATYSRIGRGRHF